MFEPSERELEVNVHRSMELFERAKVGEVALIDSHEVRTLLLVLDGSLQDVTSVAIAKAIRHRFGCAVKVLDGRESSDPSDLAQQAAESVNGEALDKLQGESFEQILSTVERSGCDLVMTPCPFGRDLDKVGNDSTGTAIDVLLARSPVPLLIVRQPYTVEDNPFDYVVMLMIDESDARPPQRVGSLRWPHLKARSNSCSCWIGMCWRTCRKWCKSWIPIWKLHPRRWAMP